MRVCVNVVCVCVRARGGEMEGVRGSFPASALRCVVVTRVAGGFRWFAALGGVRAREGLR